MRAIWSGGISFGLVYVPVKLYAASSVHRLNFDMLRKDDLCRIKYVRVCKNTGEEVPWEDIVKGYKLDNGQYVVMEDEDFEKADPKKSKSIEIISFVKQEEIPPKYFEKPYFLEPTEQQRKTYVLLRDVLKESGKVGLAKYVIRRKEHLGLLRPEGKVLYLNQMRYHADLRSPEELNIPAEEKVSEKEYELASAIVDRLTESFEPEEYKDTYREQLLKIIDQKAKHKPVRPETKAPEPTEARELVEQLKKSLELTS